MDGTPGAGEEAGGGLVDVGDEFTYEFEARPFGLHLYHCHAPPLAEHIAKVSTARSSSTRRKAARLRTSS